MPLYSGCCGGYGSNSSTPPPPHEMRWWLVLGGALHNDHPRRVWRVWCHLSHSTIRHWRHLTNKWGTPSRHLLVPFFSSSSSLWVYSDPSCRSPSSISQPTGCPWSGRTGTTRSSSRCRRTNDDQRPATRTRRVVVPQITAANQHAQSSRWPVAKTRKKPAPTSPHPSA